MTPLSSRSWAVPSSSLFSWGGPITLLLWLILLLPFFAQRRDREQAD